MMLARRILIVSAATLTLGMVATAVAAPTKAGPGILLLAHGSHAPASDTGHDSGGHGATGKGNLWNDNVLRLAERLDMVHPTEVAFGMADPRSIQAAVDRLEARGVREIAAIPLFVSSYSPIIGNFRYILGLQDHLARTTALMHLDRIRSSGARFRFAGAMDAHPLIGEILLDRAAAATDAPANTHVVVIAHGPNTEEENRQWLRDMATHAELLRKRGGFREVRVLTHRNDAPPAIKGAARKAFRREVAEAAAAGPVVVVPLLLSAGGIEAEVRADLDGLDFRFAKPLMPHPNLERWVLASFEVLFPAAGR